MIEKFLKGLLAMLREVDLGMVQPEEKLKIGEKVFGTLPEKLQRWYAVLVATRDEQDVHFEDVCSLIVGAVEDLPKEPTAEQWDAARNHKLTDIEHQLVELIFEYGVKKTFPELAILPEDEKPVICKGWKVVVRRVPSDKTRQDIIQVVKGRIIVRDLVGTPE